MSRKFFPQAIFLILLLAGSCQPVCEKPVILVSREFGNTFMNWLSRADNNIRRINMYTVSGDSIAYFLTEANGIIIRKQTCKNHET